ncbi:MAG: Mur ligase domain-containing protein, partial [Clostridia bacterium]
MFRDNSRIIHLVGIGGVSMSALAEVLNFKGFAVRGSDMNDGEHTRRLEKLGIRVHIGHEAQNVDGADLIIRTSAIHDDNPEIIRAREAGIPVIERAAAWGELMREYKDVVCVSGTHGKTTTTSMVTHIALE